MLYSSEQKVTSLIVATSLSETFLSTIFSVKHDSAGDVIVVDFDDGVHSALRQNLISSIPIRIQQTRDWTTRDKSFKELFMPGGLGFDIPTTKLEAWKMASLDRYNFWFRPDAYSEYEMVMTLRWNTAYVPIDINHPLPWMLARYSEREVIGVQCGPIRTREFYDLIKSGSFPFKKVIMNSERDTEFLKPHA